MHPFSCLSQRHWVSCSFFVSIQLYLYASRPFSILVVLIVPSFGNYHADLPRRIGIRDVISTVRRSISVHLIFRHSIGNLFAVLILRKIFKAVCPVSLVIRFHGCLGLFYVIGQQFDRDALRTFPVLVVPVIPSLCS